MLGGTLLPWKGMRGEGGFIIFQNTIESEWDFDRDRFLSDDDFESNLYMRFAPARLYQCLPLNTMVGLLRSKPSTITLKLCA